MIDPQGYLSIMSRIDDVINTSGHRISTGSHQLSRGCCGECSYSVKRLDSRWLSGGFRCAQGVGTNGYEYGREGKIRCSYQRPREKRHRIICGDDRCVVIGKTSENQKWTNCCVLCYARPQTGKSRRFLKQLTTLQPLIQSKRWLEPRKRVLKMKF